MYKNAGFYLIFFLFTCISANHLKSHNKSQYIRKKGLKVPEFTVWNVPDEPSMAFDVYPGEQITSISQKYFDFISGEDIAQNEASFGKFLPMNLVANIKVNALLSLNANIPKIPI